MQPSSLRRWLWPLVNTLAATLNSEDSVDEAEAGGFGSEITETLKRSTRNEEELAKGIYHIYITINYFLKKTVTAFDFSVQLLYKYSR